MPVRSLAMTGAPGWLTQALLDDLVRDPLPELQDIRALAHPSFRGSIATGPGAAPVTVHALDLAAPETVVAQCGSELAGVDVLLHSAAVIHVRRTADWYRVNTEGTLSLARAAQAAGVRRFVFISSNAAAGRCESASQVLTEADQPRPLSHYGRSKWLAEQGLMEMHRPGSFEVAILRPSMFYGPPVPDRHVDVYRRILSGRMPVVGDGHFRRSITYIDNLVQAVRLAMTHPAASGETFFVVDEPVYTTRKITEAMASALGVPLKELPLPYAVGPIAYQADRILAAAGVYWQNLHLVGEAHWHVALSCAKLKEKLGWKPAVELEEGMRRAVAWCRERGKI
jgi:nucleoside-diphosphate-sugar epimerase